MSLQSLKGFVDPKDIAALVIFLTSDAGKSISGQVLQIDNDSQSAAWCCTGVTTDTASAVTWGLTGRFMMTRGLREQIIGAWKLVSYEERPVDGSNPSYPLSERPKGIIMYTPDGYMSAQLMAPDRKPFASGDWFKGSDDDYRAEASTYIAYSGEFYVGEERKRSLIPCLYRCFPTGLDRRSRAS